MQTLRNRAAQRGGRGDTRVWPAVRAEVRKARRRLKNRRDSRGAVVTAKWWVTNETNRRVEIRALDGSCLCLTPLQRQKLERSTVERFALSRWVDQVTVERPRDQRNGNGDQPPRPGVIRRAYTWVRSYGGQQLYLCGSFLLGAIIPAAVIFFGADGARLLHMLTSSAARVAADGSSPVSQHDVVVTIIGRVMQIFFVAVAALLPALLYFLFDREHLDTLRNRFIRQILRFDPAIETRKEALAKYGDQMSEAYGRDASGNILPGRRSPLLLATLVVSLGWSFTLLHGDLLIVRERGIAALFEPRQAAVSFAFLGAYFYGVNAVLRGYVRKDLRPKTYSSLTVRIFVVVVLAWVLELIWNNRDDNMLLVVAFLSGIVPETALVLIQETVRGAIGTRLPGIEDEPDQLTKLEGIDLYDRARLFDEGVTNVESLAHHDVVELMLQTRIPVPRLVDWVDQAILYLHTVPRYRNDESRMEALGTLRTYGIRTATDLYNAFDGARTAKERRSLHAILGPESGGAPPRLRVIRDALDDEEWMTNLRTWRHLETVIPDTIHLEVAPSTTNGNHSVAAATA